MTKKMASVISVFLIYSLFLIVYAVCERNDQFKNQEIKQPKGKRRDSQTIDNETAIVYGDVMKNITRVNKVLEDLIKNYEKLKKIYKSQELSTEYSSDGEIDAQFNSRVSKVNIFSETSTKSAFVATAIFYSEEKNDKDDEDDDDVPDNISAAVNETNTIKPRVTKIDDTMNSHSIEVINKNTSTKKKKQKSKKKGKKTTKQNISITKKASPTRATKKLVTTVTYATVAALLAATEEAALLAANEEVTKKGVKKAKSKKTKNAKVSKSKQKNKSDYTSRDDSSSIFLVNSDEPSVELSIDMPKPDNEEVLPSVQINDTFRANQSGLYRTVKAVVHTEGFSPDTIWEEVINKPLQLDKQTEKLYNQQVMSFRTQSKLPSTQLRIVRTLSGERRDKSFSLVPSGDSLEDETNIMTEQFKTKILRKAYGDACLKVVVKKCYKACKKASIDACRKYKCNGSFKSTFQKFAKRNCIKEFRENHHSGKDSNKKNGTISKLRAPAGFIEISENGYLAAACLPPQKPAKRRLANETPPTDQKIKLNILRDRFERECQKVSADKCTVACSNASIETCSAEKCASGKLGRLKKECKRYCCWSYESRKGKPNKKHGKSKKYSTSGSSEGSDSSSSSSSGSDTDLSDLSEENKRNKTKIKHKSKNKGKSKKTLKISEEGKDSADDKIADRTMKKIRIVKENTGKRKSQKHNKRKT